MGEAKTTECQECENVGWLLKDDPKTITLAHSIGRHGGSETCSYTVIPRGCITKMTQLRRIDSET